MNRSEGATDGPDGGGVGRPDARLALIRVGRGQRWSSAMAAAWVVVLAYGWWFTDRRPFSRGAFLALVVAVGVLIVCAEVRRTRVAVASSATAAPRSRRFRTAVVVWSALSVVVVAWELIALRSLPRSAHPTISSLVESAEQYHLARIWLYAAWVWFGWTMVS